MMNLPLLLFLAASEPAAVEPAAKAPPRVVVVGPAKVEGAVRLHLNVGRDGFTKKCTVLQTSGKPADDERACRFFLGVRRSVIQRDEKGEPTEYERTFWVHPSALKQLRDAGI